MEKLLEWLSIIQWNEVATIATTVGVMISALGLMLILHQLADARRFNRAQFINTLDVDLKRYSSVYRKFIPGGSLYQVEDYEMTFDEKMDVLEYLGFYEKVYFLYKMKAVDLEVIYAQFGGRFHYTMSNKLITEYILGSDYPKFYKSLYELETLLEPIHKKATANNANSTNAKVGADE